MPFSKQRTALPLSARSPSNALRCRSLKSQRKPSASQSRTASTTATMKAIKDFKMTRNTRKGTFIDPFTLFMV